MSFSYKDLRMNSLEDLSSIAPISVSSDVEVEDLNKIITIIDESGDEVSCTYAKFMQIFDKEGLAGFIL